MKMSWKWKCIFLTVSLKLFPVTAWGLTAVTPILLFCSLRQGFKTEPWSLTLYKSQTSCLAWHLSSGFLLKNKRKLLNILCLCQGVKEGGKDSGKPSGNYPWTSVHPTELNTRLGPLQGDRRGWQGARAAGNSCWPLRLTPGACPTGWCFSIASKDRSALGQILFTSEKFRFKVGVRS